MDIIQSLINLEPVVFKAGQLAVSMQGTAKHHNKTETGWNIVDIVTEADLAVQEFMLKEIIKTDLVNCKIFAEENTPSVSFFNPNGKYYLSSL